MGVSVHTALPTGALGAGKKADFARAHENMGSIDAESTFKELSMADAVADLTFLRIALRREPPDASRDT
jgi:hypothetical protein